jgi:uncharacterized protein (DUF2345 family)
MGDQRKTQFTSSNAKGNMLDIYDENMIRVGYVLDVDPGNRVCSIVVSGLESTGPIADVPWGGEAIHNTLGGGVNAIPTRGTMAIVLSVSNLYFTIIKFLPDTISRDLFEKFFEENAYIGSFEDPPKFEAEEKKVETGEKSQFYDFKEQKFPRNQSGTAPKDLHLGDYELTGTDGERVGVYRGGLIRIFANHVTQTLYFKFRSLIRTISRRWDLWTDHGKLEFRSGEDKTSMEFKAGTSFKEETHPSIEEWRLRVHTGSGINPPGGEEESPLVSTHITEPLADPEQPEEGPPDPNLEANFQQQLDDEALYYNKLYPCGEREEYSVENLRETAVKTIFEESLEENIEEKAAVDIVSDAGENIFETAGVNIEESAGESINSQAGQNIERIAGQSITHRAEGGDITHTAQAGNISHTAAQNYSVTTQQGDISLSTIPGNINITTLAGNIAITTTKQMGTQGTMNSVVGLTAVFLTAPLIGVGGALLPAAGPALIPGTPIKIDSAGSGASFPGVNGLSLITKYNAHTHTYNSPSGASQTSPPSGPTDLLDPTPGGDITLTQMS